MHRAMLTICLLSGAAFATGTMTGSAAPTAPREVKVEQPSQDGAPARVQTKVGTFEVQPKNADLLRRMLAGEPVNVEFYAGSRE